MRKEESKMLKRMIHHGVPALLFFLAIGVIAFGLSMSKSHPPDLIGSFQPSEANSDFLTFEKDTYIFYEYKSLRATEGRYVLVGHTITFKTGPLKNIQATIHKDTITLRYPNDQTQTYQKVSELPIRLQPVDMNPWTWN